MHSYYFVLNKQNSRPSDKGLIDNWHREHCSIVAFKKHLQREFFEETLYRDPKMMFFLVFIAGSMGQAMRKKSVENVWQASKNFGINTQESNCK